jgi:hypothetical protein
MKYLIILFVGTVLSLFMIFLINGIIQVTR